MTNDTMPVGRDPASATMSAREQAGEVTSTAMDHAQQVAGTASDQAAAVAQHATEQARNVLGDARDQAHRQAQLQTGQLADALERWRDQARALVDGRPDDAGAVGDMARQATERLGVLAGSVRERGFDGIVDDVQQFARRRPGAFLLGAAAAGFVVGRLVRSGALQAGGPQPNGAGTTLSGPAALPAGGPDRVTGTAPAEQTSGLSSPAAVGRPAPPAPSPEGIAGPSERLR
jgi:uncharacterized protein YjbJ (UPF0337 family)